MKLLVDLVLITCMYTICLGTRLPTEREFSAVTIA